MSHRAARLLWDTARRRPDLTEAAGRDGRALPTSLRLRFLTRIWDSLLANGRRWELFVQAIAHGLGQRDVGVRLLQEGGAAFANEPGIDVVHAVTAGEDDLQLGFGFE